MADKTVKGAVSKVIPEIINFLKLVAKYGGHDVVIVENGGFRSPEAQALAMFKTWTTTINRGRVYVPLAFSEAVRHKLDGFYVIAKESKSATADQKAAAEADFKALAAQTPSLHTQGKAVDLNESFLTGPMKLVLMKYMKRVDEKGCFHVQYKGALPPEDAVRKAFGTPEEAAIPGRSSR